MNARFCRYCGQTLEQGNRFCMHCGQSTEQPLSVSNPTNGQTWPATKQPVMPVTTGKVKRKPTVILLLVGLLVFLFGLRVPLVSLLGTSTVGVVTSVRQRINSSSSQMDYNYDISYRFNTREGQTINGSYSMNRTYDVRRLPAAGSQLRIKYLPGLAFVHLPVDRGGQGYAGLILLALGVILIVMGMRGVQVSFRRRY